MEEQIPPRILQTLLQSLSSGVVPRVGLPYIAVGRKAEIDRVLVDYDAVAQGGASFRLIVGRYGSGKSFFMQMMRDKALADGFVVADADLSPERRLVGGKGEGLATYRELMANLSLRTRPEGAALDVLLQRWLSSLSSQDDGQTMDGRIDGAVGQIEGMVHSHDFARVLKIYLSACQTADMEKRRMALRWFSGEYSTKSEAKQELGVSAIVDDENWYDYIKLWARFVASIGYKGLLIFIDEAVNLYKISHRVARERNYEKLLTIFNDVLQGKAPHLGVFVGGTPQLVEDPHRGLYSYEALKSRLAPSRYAEDYAQSGPQIQLQRLSNEEILLLLQRLRALFSMQYEDAPRVSDEELVAFMQKAVDRMGADELLTPREVTRDFLELLEMLRLDPNVNFLQRLGEQQFQSDAVDPDEAGARDGDDEDPFADFFSL